MANDHELEMRRTELSETEIAAKISERAARARRVWITTVGGVIGGTSGLIFAFVALLKFESVPLSILGFVVMGVGFGIASPDQIVKLLRSWRGS